MTREVQARFQTENCNRLHKKKYVIQLMQHYVIFSSSPTCIIIHQYISMSRESENVTTHDTQMTGAD